MYKRQVLRLFSKRFVRMEKWVQIWSMNVTDSYVWCVWSVPSKRAEWSQMTRYRQWRDVGLWRHIRIKSKVKTRQKRPEIMWLSLVHSQVSRQFFCSFDAIEIGSLGYLRPNRRIKRRNGSLILPIQPKRFRCKENLATSLTWVSGQPEVLWIDRSGALLLDRRVNTGVRPVFVAERQLTRYG